MDIEKVNKRIEAIDDSIARGVHSVKFDQKEIIYRSLEEMLQARELLKKELNRGKSRTTRRTAVYSRGL